MKFVKLLRNYKLIAQFMLLLNSTLSSEQDYFKAKSACLGPCPIQFWVSQGRSSYSLLLSSLWEIQIHILLLKAQRCSWSSWEELWHTITKHLLGSSVRSKQTTHLRENRPHHPPCPSDCEQFVLHHNWIKCKRDIGARTGIPN